MKISDEVQVQARSLIADRLGLDFQESRQADLERGLRQALGHSPVRPPEQYLAWLATLPDESPEWSRLASSLTVGETYFFRDRSCIDALEQQILPALIAARRSAGFLRLRCWSAGCATGAEPYSLAILLNQLLPDHPKWALTILATDINPAALEFAQLGLYSDWALRETPQWIRDRYFHRRGKDTFELDPAIRQMVTFAPLNLAKNSFPALMTNTSAMDLIVCRNVLMYFTSDVQRATVARLQEALVTEGWLVVSPAETSTELFRPLISVNLPGAIFYRKSQDSSVTPLPYLEPETVMPEFQNPLCSTGEFDSLNPYQPPVTSPIVEEQIPRQPDRATNLQPVRILADQGHLEQARRLCETLLAQDRLNPDAFLLLAAICQEQGEIPAALEALRRVIYLAPNSAAAHFMRGCLLLRQGDRKQGRLSLEAVVNLLRSAAPDEAVPGSDGLTAGRLLETARAYLEMQR
jgi:chemotaxis protein methyltransferase CheR